MVAGGTTITAGSGTTWTLSNSYQITATTDFTTTGLLSTPFQVTFEPTETEKTFYNASTRLNTGDRIHLYVSYTNGSPTNQAHDITAQIDMF